MGSARAHGPGNLSGRRHGESVTRLLAIVEEGDIDAFVECFTPDCTMEFPLAPAGVPQQLHGHDELRDFYGSSRSRAISVRAQAVDILPLLSGDGVVVEYTESATFEGGAQMEGHYCAIVRFRDGRIVRWREFFDPAAIAAAAEAAS